MSGRRTDRRPGLVYAIVDVERTGAKRVPGAIAAIAEAGVETIQIRAKRCGDGELARVVRESKIAAAGWPGELWIDDRVDLALLFGLPGVHLGQLDLEASVARRLLPEDCAIGVSTHDGGQLARADGDPAADWVALGPIFATSSKSDPDPVVGVEALRSLRATTSKPLIAIGGIGPGNLREVLVAGADSVAVLSALVTEDVGGAARELVERAVEARCASS